jgi:hypothetical protein
LLLPTSLNSLCTPNYQDVNDPNFFPRRGAKMSRSMVKQLSQRRIALMKSSRSSSSNRRGLPRTLSMMSVLLLRKRKSDMHDEIGQPKRKRTKRNNDDFDSDMKSRCELCIPADYVVYFHSYRQHEPMSPVGAEVPFSSELHDTLIRGGSSRGMDLAFNNPTDCQELKECYSF